MQDNLYRQIENYKPANLKQEKDKESFLLFMERNDDCYKRSNPIGHITTSAWILNKSKTKVLMIYHNIFNSWAWVGGHADGEIDLVQVIKREIEEETGVKGVILLKDDIFSINVIDVDCHIKNGKYISDHLHFDVEYLLEADDSEELRIKEDENSGVKWIDIDDVLKVVNEEKMKPIYQDLIMRSLNEKN